MRASTVAPTQFPTFPYLTSTQGSNTNLVRAAMEPNTVVSDGPFDAPVYVSTTYVLENYPYTGTGYTFFDLAHNLIIDPVIGGFGTNAVTAPIGDYTTTSTQNLPIDGYMSSAYYLPGHGGEGLVIDIYDNGDNATRTIFAAWYTYDTVGLPFWLVAQGSMPLNTNNLTERSGVLLHGRRIRRQFLGCQQQQLGHDEFQLAGLQHAELYVQRFDRCIHRRPIRIGFPPMEAVVRNQWAQLRIRPEPSQHGPIPPAWRDRFFLAALAVERVDGSPATHAIARRLRAWFSK